MADDIERYGGEPFEIGGKKYVLAPMSIASMRRFQKFIAAATAGDLPMEESFDGMLEVIGNSLRRNYPSLTQEEIEDQIVDMTNLRGLFQAVLKASGFKSVENVEPGKAPAGSRGTSKKS